MVTTTIRSTYVMDVKTAQALDRIARRWGVSTWEALRRAIRAAAEQPSLEPGEAVRALDQLQRSLKLTRARTRARVQTARRERRATSARGEGRGRYTLTPAS